MSHEKLPYVFLGSAPIGPIALTALEAAHYPPTLVIDDPKLKTEELILLIEEQKPTFLLVVGYGAILKQAILDTVAGQVLNIHPSYLPAYRGPAPVVQALLDGVTETGVTLMEVDVKMDHGPIIAQEAYPLRGNEYPDELYQVLTKKGVQLFLENVDDYLLERMEPMAQNHADATITRFITKEDGHLHWSEPADQLERKVRALAGWPRAWIVLNDKRLLIDRAHVVEGSLIPQEVQPENGKPMSFQAFAAGLRQKPDEVLAEIARQNP